MEDFLVALAVLLLALAGCYIDTKRKPKDKKNDIKSKPVEPERSFAARKVIVHYEAIPAEHRPGMEGIIASVEALDLKYKIADVDAHLIAYGYNGFECQCGTHGDQYCKGNRKVYNACKRYPEYINLYLASEKMQRALRERERALEVANHKAAVAGRQFDIDRVAEITASVIADAEIITEVNGEIYREAYR